MANNKYEQRFFSALKDTFVGHKIKGKSGYVNLLDLKQQYFAQIEPYIKNEIEKSIVEEAREELFEKLYSFFDSYLNETGTVFFANSQLHKNLYERVYSDRDDVSLFWKTQKLYYVKSEAMYDDLETEIEGITYFFKASDLKHAKGNEKKTLVFYLTDVQPTKLTFKVRYQEPFKYDRLKEYLEIEEPNKLKDYLIENYGSSSKGEINYIKNNIDRNVFKRKGDLRDCIYFSNEDDAINSVQVEFSPSKIDLIHQYCLTKSVVCTEEEIKKAFHIYKKQNEVDYFIHKDAEGFLKEQFDIYMYNWLFNDSETEFDTATVSRIQNIKRIAYKVIEYIAKFESELKAIWEKPKFVRKSNYVLTLDRIFPIINTDGNSLKVQRDYKNEASVNFIKKLFIHDGIVEQKKEWKKENLSVNDVILKNSFNPQYRNLVIDTKYFESLKIEILSLFPNYRTCLDGILIKTDNWQGLNTITRLYNNSVKTIFIDPPFNKENEADYAYKVKYKNSTWNTILENRINNSKNLLSEDGSYFVRCDYNGNFLVKMILDSILGEGNYRNEIIVNRFKRQLDELSRLNFATESLFYYGKSDKHKPNKIYRPRNCTFCGHEIEPNWRPMSSPGLRDSPIENEYLHLFSDKVVTVDENGKRRSKARIIGGKELLPPKGRHWTFKQSRIFEMEKNGRLRINNKISFKDLNGEKQEGLPEYLQTEETPVDTTWTDLKGYAFGSSFNTENAEELLKRVLQFSANPFDLILDYFLGSGTTIAVAQKLKMKWLGMEIGEHLYSYIIPRLKEVLSGDSNGISNDEDVKWEGGGMFKYYELEQYEDVLAKAKYQWKQKNNPVEHYSFMQDQKLLEALEIDYKNKNVKVVFEKLYPDIDIAETLSNLSGKPIKELGKDYCILIDRETDKEMKIVYDEMTFEKYPWVKPLIWWHSK